MKLLQINQTYLVEFIVGCIGLNPFIVESLLRGHSFSGVQCEHLGDQILGIL